MESRSCDLLSRSWKPRKASSITQPESKCLRMREADVNLHLKAGKDEMGCHSSAVRQKKEGKFLLPLPFVLFKPSVDSPLLIYTREDNLL